MVIIADFTVAADHNGFLPSNNAPNPAICGAAMDVPDRNPKFWPLDPAGETAASTPTPGAAMSGFRRSPLAARVGPREENPAICGTGGGSRPVVSVDTRLAVNVASAPTASLMAGSSRWTVGTLCRSTSSELGVRLTRTMPTPPAWATVMLFAVRSTTPRSQTTILPAVLAGSKVPGAHRAALASTASAVLRAAASAMGAFATSVDMMLAPANFSPLDNSTVPRRLLLWVEAATLVIQGAAWFTVLAAGPELPADAATKIPAAAAFRKAMDTGSTVELLVPEME
ncbi:hypothetical protein D9M72_408130 [compost metagenome]